MCKRNKLPTEPGDGQHAPLPGNILSVDYQGKINPISVRGFSGFYLFKDSCSGMRHAELVKYKSAATFQKALSNVIKFYNSHGHTVLKLRCDAGSTENDESIGAWLASEHGVTVDPAAVGKQNQNPVEREVQTLIKGVGCLLLDQESLSSKWWCYAVQSWIQTANCRPNSNREIGNSTSPLEIITGVTPDLEKKFLFPFGCPVTFITPTGRDTHFSPSSERGFAVSSTEGNCCNSFRRISDRLTYQSVNGQPLTIKNDQEAITT
jgi:hypothetical protein